MAGITLAQAQAKLTLWMAADDAVATGQSYSIAGRSLSRADAKYIQDRIEYWDRQVKRITRGGIRVRGATPI
ncbi:MAG TPA: DUF6148 family protein [Bacteroidales bacterium]|nr:DUF6148 family protein [Bacteroidales bacterium]